MHFLFFCLICLGLLLTNSCSDDESSYKTENCTVVVAVDGQTVTLCCRLKCEASWDGDDFRERCVEEPTCTTSTGALCPLSVVQAVGFPPCLY